MELIKAQPLDQDLINLNRPLVDQVSIDQDRIRAADNIGRPPFVLKIGGVSKWSKGDISAIKGKAKSKKTFLLKRIAANLVAGSGNALDEIFTPLTQGMIAWVDTEQSPWDAKSIPDTIKKLAGNDDRLLFYALRRYDKATRLKKLEKLLADHGKEIDVLIIDGIKDLCQDFNDNILSDELVTNQMAWTVDYNLHICNVLHANKSDGNMRGHLGTELENKSQLVLGVEKDPVLKNVSLVSEEYGRGKNIDDFKITINQYGLPEILTEGFVDEDDVPY